MEAEWATAEAGCPLPATHQALVEAIHHLGMMGMAYHKPALFLTHLNSFIQAQRNITFKLQAEKRKLADFSWYRDKQVALRNDPFLQRFNNARLAVVHQAGLAPKSTFRSGLFRGRQMKLAAIVTLPIMTESQAALEQLRRSSFAELLVDRERTTIGEQLGVERSWMVEDVGDQEILTLCAEALNKISEVVWEAHSRLGSSYRGQPIIVDDFDRQEFQVLLETDLNPSLAHRWGWPKALQVLERYNERGSK